jgi:hypothetical protein
MFDADAAADRSFDSLPSARQLGRAEIVHPSLGGSEGYPPEERAIWMSLH